MEKRSLNKQRILLTGATGYVGSRLLSRLLDSGFSVRCAARTPESLSHIDYKNVEIGGPDVVFYMGIMREYARQRGVSC